MDIQMEGNFPDYHSSNYVACAVEHCNSSSELDFQNWKEKEEIRNLVCFSKQGDDKCGQSLGLL